MNENLKETVEQLNECRTHSVDTEEGLCAYNAIWFLIEYCQDLENRIDKLENKNFLHYGNIGPG